MMHEAIYPEILHEVKNIMFDQMAKPKEVLLSIDENGDVEEEHFEDTENEALYEQMRETLIYLTNIDVEKMNGIVQARLEEMAALSTKDMVDFEKLNKFCWALGTISGCMYREDENKFLCFVIKELLNLCEKMHTKNHKAFIATDIMYVVG